MRKVAAGIFITMDGVTEEPGNWKEVPPSWPQDDTFTKIRYHDEYKQESR